MLDGERIAGHRVVDAPAAGGVRRLAGGAARGDWKNAAGAGALRRPGRRSRAASRWNASRSTSTTRAFPTTPARARSTPRRADGPAAYFTTLPIKAMLAALREAGIPAEVSQTAGTYVCNHVFYGLMHALRRASVPGSRRLHPHSVFARAGRAPSRRAEPCRSVVTQALRLAVATALTVERDARFAAGATH